MAAKDTPTQGVRCRLGPNKGTQREDLIFRLNPERMPRRYSAVYAPVPVARQDYNPQYPVANPPPVWWTRNNAEHISVEFLLVSERNLGEGGRTDVEAEILQLERFRFNDRTGEPPDLIWSVGARNDTVRIESMQIDPRVWTPELKIEQAHVTLDLIVIRPRTSRSS